MRKPKRTPKQMEKLTKDVIEFYFNNPHANGYKYMREKFGVTDSTIRQTISEELDRRFNNAKRVNSVQENKETKE